MTEEENLRAELARVRAEHDLVCAVFCELHAKAQTLAYEVSVRPEAYADEAIQIALDELTTTLLENMPHDDDQR